MKLKYIICLYCWDYIKDEMSGVCSIYGQMRNIQKILVGKPKGERPLESRRHTWEDNTKMAQKEKY
jgi:hypothetical protein